jgi:hypothetical protein
MQPALTDDTAWSKQIFPKKELRSNVSVNDLYIPKIGLNKWNFRCSAAASAPGILLNLHKTPTKWK